MELQSHQAGDLIRGLVRASVENSLINDLAVLRVGNRVYCVKQLESSYMMPRMVIRQFTHAMSADCAVEDVVCVI